VELDAAKPSPSARRNDSSQLLTLARQPDKATLAIKAFHRFLAQRPGHLGARRNLALLYLQVGDHRAALAQLEAVLRIRPDDVEAQGVIELIDDLSRLREKSGLERKTSSAPSG
jgi:thioredoxin-like negative regulator of GroEL